MPTQNQLMLKALEAIKENDHLKAAELLECVQQDDPNLVFVTQDDELTLVYQGLTILMTPTKFRLIE